jgi:hypothetical protein
MYVVSTFVCHVSNVELVHPDFVEAVISILREEQQSHVIFIWPHQNFQPRTGWTLWTQAAEESTPLLPLSLSLLFKSKPKPYPNPYPGPNPHPHPNSDPNPKPDLHHHPH